MYVNWLKYIFPCFRNTGARCNFITNHNIKQNLELFFFVILDMTLIVVDDWTSLSAMFKSSSTAYLILLLILVVDLILTLFLLFPRALWSKILKIFLNWSDIPEPLQCCVGPPVGCYHRTANPQHHFPSQSVLGYSQFSQPLQNFRLCWAEVTSEPRVSFVVRLPRLPDSSALQPGVAGDLLQCQPRTRLPLQNACRSEIRSHATTSLQHHLLWEDRTAGSSFVGWWNYPAAGLKINQRLGIFLIIKTFQKIPMSWNFFNPSLQYNVLKQRDGAYKVERYDWRFENFSLPKYFRFLILFKTFTLPALKGIEAVTRKYSRIPRAQMSTGAPI